MRAQEQQQMECSKTNVCAKEDPRNAGHKETTCFRQKCVLRVHFKRKEIVHHKHARDCYRKQLLGRGRTAYAPSTLGECSYGSTFHEQRVRCSSWPPLWRCLEPQHDPMNRPTYDRVSAQRNMA
eukprot:136720-Pelagomonas_calceolata.AAC.5